MTHPTRHAARGAALLVAAAVTLGGALPGFAAARPADAPVAASGTADAVAAHRATVTLVTMTPGVVRPGADVTVTVDVVNGTRAVLDAPVVTVTLDRYRDTARSDLSAWTGAGRGDEIGSVVGRTTTTALAPGRSRQVTVTVDADSLGLGTGADVWGPRGLAVTLTDGADPTTAPDARLAVLRTFLLWYPPTDESDVRAVQLAVAVPVTGPPVTASEPEAAAAEISAATQPGTRLDHVVAATRDLPDVSWAVDPALVASASTSSDAAARTWAQQVCAGASTGRTVYALPAYDADVAAYAHSGHRVPSGGPTLTTARCAGSETGSTSGTTPTSSPTSAPTATPTGSATASPSRSSANLAAEPSTNLARVWTHGLAWPAEDVPDLATITTAVDSGRGTVVTVPGSTGALSVTEDDAVSSVVSTVSTSAGDARLLVADGTVSRVLAHDEVSAQDTQLLLATTAVLSRADEQGSTERATLLAAMPRDWDPDPTSWGAALDDVDDAPWVRLTHLSTVVDDAPSAVPRQGPTARSKNAHELPASSVDALTKARSQVAAFSGVVTDRAAVTTPTAAALLSPASVAFRTARAARADEVTAALRDVDALTSSVSVVPGSAVNLISSRAGLPVTVRNTLDQPVTVTISMKSSDPKLVVEGSPTVVVPAGRDRTVRVGVRAVGNGDVGVTVQLRSAAGRPVGDSSSFDVRVRAGWEAVGTWVVLVLLGAAFVAGIWRTVRRGRSSARTTRRDSPEAETAGTDTSELQARHRDEPSDTTTTPESEDRTSHRDTRVDRTR
ncbi:DUF6049 family protein [Luteimicrobium subarcticum]|uniref:Uncharacterized protein n=1 Tax=Luteimicrobium subarcticum TaxID=620910 RepID=A0A2M8WJI2_9MICO|nr:DUF6049 family protein [Luteimicrobium subarcticum]PJI91085.1 hypothetical protein CLV34_2349 [Luteimicrobium subarcticum]